MYIANSLRVVAIALSASVLTALVGSCTALQPTQVISPDLHVLDARPAPGNPPVKRNLVLEVSAPRAWPGFDTPQMVYVQKPHSLDYYANNRWADSPARMLGPLLARALEETGGFRAIVQSPSAVPADLRLTSELILLQQDFTTRPSRVELSLRVQLVDVRTRRVLATKTIDVTETAGSDDPYGGVAAANLALQRVLTQVTEFCVAESAAP